MLFPSINSDIAFESDSKNNLLLVVSHWSRGTKQKWSNNKCQHTNNLCPITVHTVACCFHASHLLTVGTFDKTRATQQQPEYPLRVI